MRDRFPHQHVTSGGFLYSYLICNMSTKECVSPVNTYTSNIVNWYRNRPSKPTSSYIMLFRHGRRFNWVVSNHAINRQFVRILRWFWQYLFHMPYEYEFVEIDLSILEFPIYSINSGIAQRKPQYRASRYLYTAGNWIRQYQIMPNNITICRIAAYGTHYT